MRTIEAFFTITLSISTTAAVADTDAWQSQCLRGGRAACGKLAWEERTAGNKASARAWYERACGLGDRKACFDMAILSESLGDWTKANDGFDRACRFGNKNACVRVRATLAPAAAAVPSAATPAPMQTDDCTRGDAAACLEIARARRLLNDVGGERVALERACRLGSLDGCMASAERIGDAQACHQGGRQMCFKMSERLHTMGRTLAAAKLRETACVLGEEQACKPKLTH